MSGRAATTDRRSGRYALSVGLTDMPAPQGWCWVELGRVARLESGHTPSRRFPSYWKGDFPWIGIKDARTHHGKRIIETIQTVSQEGLDNSAARLLPAGTVCLSRTASVGYVLVMGRPMATSQDFVNWVCSEAIEPEFLMNLFIAEGASLLRFGKGTTHTTIYYPEVKAFHVCLPPRPEQRRIVTALDSHFTRLDAAVAALERVQRNLKRYRASVLKAAVEGRLVPTEAELAKQEGRDYEPASELLKRIVAERRRRWEETELAKMKAKGKVPRDDRWKAKYKEAVEPDGDARPRLPNGWCWASWSQIGLSQNGRAFPSKQYSAEGVRLLRPGNLDVSGGVEWTAKNTRYMPEQWELDFPDYVVGPHELVMNLTAQSLADEFLGRVCMTGPTDHCLLNQRLARLTPVLIEPAFMLWWLKTPVFRRFVNKLNTGSLIQHMFTSQLAGCMLPLPPAAEQERILNSIERHMENADVLEAGLKNTHNRTKPLRQSILKWAFEGKLADQDPSDEPARVLLERIIAERAAAVPAAKKKTSRRPRRKKVTK